MEVIGTWIRNNLQAWERLKKFAFKEIISSHTRGIAKKIHDIFN